MSKKRLLIVVDMQNDFIDGALGTPEAVAIVPKVRKKIEGYRRSGDPVIFTRDTHGPDYPETQEGRRLPVPHCIAGTDGWQIYPALDVSGCELADKPSFGSLPLAGRVAELDRENGGFGYIELVGLCTDICVISNALILKAALPETELRVDPECCAGVTPESHLNALAAMRMCQIVVE